MKAYYTTSQAAELLSVSADTVLKWVRAGKIPSYRTPGGHSRIPADAVEALLPPQDSRAASFDRADSTPPYSYCWDFYAGEGGVRQECRNCIAFKSRAQRCYQMREIPDEFGHLRLFCQSSCEDCDFYRLTHNQVRSTLIVSRNRIWREQLRTQADLSSLRLEFVGGEYECALMIEKFRPDFIVMDCSLGKARIKSLSRHLTADERIPLSRIILTSRRAEWAAECEQDVFGWIEKPFSVKQLEEFVTGAIHWRNGESVAETATARRNG
jgi:excisionase family DNA binding protein